MADKFRRFCEDVGLEHIRRLAEDGYADEEIAIRSDIEPAVFRRWKKKYPEFAAAVELGRSGSDFAVVHSLYKKAVGYSVSVNKTHKLKRVDYDPDTGKKLREYEELATGVDESYIPPDLRAEMFWLKNRQPERWSDKPDCDSGQKESIGGVIELPEADMLGELPEKTECDYTDDEVLDMDSAGRFELYHRSVPKGR